MFRTMRHFGKNEGRHNFYGELEYIEDWEQGTSEENVTEPEPIDHDKQEDEQSV